MLAANLQWHKMLNRKPVLSIPATKTEQIHPIYERIAKISTQGAALMTETDRNCMDSGLLEYIPKQNFNYRYIWKLKTCQINQHVGSHTVYEQKFFWYTGYRFKTGLYNKAKAMFPTKWRTY